MKVSTSRFGEFDVPEESIVTFPLGLVGLPNHTRYVVFDVEQDSGYQWLQSLEDATLAVVIAQAELIQANFSDHVSEESVTDLEIRNDDQISLSVIVTIPPGRPDLATVNLRAPIVVNLRTRKAKQIILHESLALQRPLASEEQGAVEEKTVCMQGATTTTS